MQAGVIQPRESGPALGLWPASLMLPSPVPDVLAVRHTAIGVNFVDAYYRAGLCPMPVLPVVFGAEGADVVEAVGTDVRGFMVSQRVVWAGLMDGASGGYTSYRNVSVERAITLPDALDDETVAATLVRGITAHMLLTRVRQVSTGGTVLVHAVAGGLDVLLVQWAKRQGAHVIDTVDSETKAVVTIGHGVDHAVLYRQQDVRDAMLQLTGGEGVDYVIDGVGGAMLSVSLAVTRSFRMVVNIGQAGDVGNARTNVVDLVALGLARSIAPVWPGALRYMVDLSNYRTGAQAVLQCMLDDVCVLVDGIYVLEDTAAAYTALEAGQTLGVLLLHS